MRDSRQAPESFFRPGSHRPAMGFSRILFPDGRSPALTRAAREAPVGRGDPIGMRLARRAPPPLPGSQNAPFGSQSNDSYWGFSPRLGRLGNSPAQPFFARRTSLFDVFPDPSARHARLSRHAPHGREGQRKKERVYTLPSAHVRTRMRARPPLRERELFQNNLL